MAAQSVTFGCSALVGLNKQGVLKPDDKGYYELTVGGFNIHNKAGAYYPLGDAKKLFEESGALMRRLKAGVLRGEYGHPRRGNMSLVQFTQRLNDIVETQVCCHFGEVRLETNNYKSASGFPVVAVVAKVKPSGPYGASLKEALENPKEEVCFSVRAAVIPNIVNGVEERMTQDIVTWDYVNEGGIGIARKYFSMALEDMDNVLVTPTVLKIATETAVKTMGLESNDAQRLMDLQRRLGWANGANNSAWDRPASLRWK